MSQSGPISAFANPAVPGIFVTDSGTAVPAFNILDIFSSVTPAGSFPIQTTGSSNTVRVNVQTSQAIASSDATKIGLAAFNSSQFAVDANGFVTFTGSSGSISFVTNSGTAAPIANILNILGATSAAGSTPVSTSGSTNDVTLKVQISQAIGATDVTKVGLAAFNSSDFTVDANGFVALAGGGGGVTTIDGDTGSATGATITFNANSNAGESVLFFASGATVDLIVTDAHNNTFIGSGAGKAGNITGDNVALGKNALSSIDVTGNGNVAIGSSAGAAITTGAGNCLLGEDAGLGITQGDGNCLIGNVAGFNITTGSSNIAIGGTTLPFLITGSTNIAIGANSGINYAGAESNNILIAHQGTVSESGVIHIGTAGTQTSCYIAGIEGVSVSNTNMVTIDTTTGQLGSQAVPGGGGISTLNGDTGSATGATVTVSAGNSTQACGSSVLFDGSGAALTMQVTDASFNTIMGFGAGNATISGSQNTSFGLGGFHFLTSGNANSCLGYGAGVSISTGSNNTCVGTNVLGSGTAITGSQNVGVGFGAISSIIAGSSNTAVGFNAGGNYNGSESSNILIGSAGVNAESNVIRIGDQGSGDLQQNTCYIAGIAGVTVANSAAVLIDTTTGQLGTVISSKRYKENIEDMGDKSSRLLDLRPVTFSYKSDAASCEQYGLIAEEVEKVFPELVLYNKEGLPESVYYHLMPAMLLNEIIKLKKEIEILKKDKLCPKQAQ